MRLVNFILFFLLLQSVTVFSEGFSAKDFSLMSIDELKTEEKKLKKGSKDYTNLVKLGIVYHFMSLGGEKTAKKAIATLEDALFIKEDYIVKAYLGSAYTLLGDEKKDPNSKIVYVKKGLAILDEIYENNKDDYEVSLVFISVCSTIPDVIFRRLNTAVDIIQYIENNKTTTFAELTNDEIANLLYLKYETYFKINGKEKDALSYLQEIVDNYGDTIYSQKAEKILSIYND